MFQDSAPYTGSNPLQEIGNLRAEIRRLRAVKEPTQALKTAIDSERKYHELVTRMRSGVTIFTTTDDGADFVCQSVNPATERITGKLRGLLVGKRFSEYRSGAGSLELLSVMQRVWQSGESAQFPTTAYDGSHLVKWHDHFIYRLPAGEIVIICDDLTTEKQLEECLRSSSDRMRTLLDGLADGVLTATLQDRHFTYANPAVCAMFGYTPEEILRLGVADIPPPAALPAIIAEFEAQARRKKKVAYHLPCRHKDGHIFYADISTTPIRDKDGSDCNIGIFRESRPDPA